MRRLAASPVHQIADPALAARLLGCDEGALLADSLAGPVVPRDGLLLGVLFQSLVTVSVRAYAQQNEARVHHLRTHAGEREIDLIVERGDGRVVALEVKLSSTADDRDVGHLRWLAEHLGPELDVRAPTSRSLSKASVVHIGPISSRARLTSSIACLAVELTLDRSLISFTALRISRRLFA